MKRFLLSVVGVAIATLGYGKQVKFSVDMGTHSVSPLGIHVMGTFQDEAGFGADLTPNGCQLIQEGSSTIYSRTVNIPAFRLYEFIFVNGDQTYEAEFVPDESKVDIFNGNRWIYVDSLDNGVTVIGNIPFGGNAPAGKSLIRFKVDMGSAGTVSPKGIHVAGTFQNSSFSPVETIMYTFTTNTFEVISYVVNGSYQFKFYNGNTLGNSETIPGWCAVGGNRNIVVTKDTVMPAICFSACSTCALAGIKEEVANRKLNLYPNPATDFAIVELGEADTYQVTMTDVTGRVIRNYADLRETDLRIEKNGLPGGVYYVSAVNSNGLRSDAKLIIQ